MEKIPVYYMELDEQGNPKYGIEDIALVSNPAYEELFAKFSNEEIKLNFAVNDEEQRIITGAVMIPDKLVYRNEKGKDFYVVATKDTVYEAAQKFASENRNRRIKLTHETDTNTSDVFIFESFVTNENRVKEVVNFEHLPIGTWFITCKVESDEVWNQVKQGTFNGFSLEALFKMKPAAQLTEREIEALKNII
jgi:hypothetical protein